MLFVGREKRKQRSSRWDRTEEKAAQGVFGRLGRGSRTRMKAIHRLLGLQQLHK